MSLTPRIVSDISAISARDWEALDHEDNPFLSLAFLRALESSGCVSAATGWQPNHLCLYQGERLVAAAPTYLKSHSHGEFVFDWAWAEAFERHGRNYYPKLLTAVPYSPVSGPRLLVSRAHSQPESLRRQLVALAMEQCEELELSSWHCNFNRPGDAPALKHPELLERVGWQFHWFNPGYESFEQFLGQLRSKKRKNMRRDRRLVSEAGIRFVRKSGAELSETELDFVYRCYRATFREHGNHPALNKRFFQQLIADLPRGVLAILALRDELPVAMSLYLMGGERLYGRYWGCTEEIPGLHFETAYHQGIEFCIQHGLKVFEPGAQGEHKISRGFVPVQTTSYHQVRDQAFRQAIARFLERERDWLNQYRLQLAEHEPYRSDCPR